MNIVLLGCPGAGKGTLAKQLQIELFEDNYQVLTPGDLYRREAKLGTPFGLKAKEYWGGGNLCPDEMTNELIDNTLKNVSGTSNIVFDGYPRNIVQAKFLDGITKIHCIIDLHITDDIAVKRLLARREKENRPDDTEDIIKQRLSVYHSNNDKIIEYYKADEDRYIFIDANKPIDDVFEEAVQEITIRSLYENR